MAKRGRCATGRKARAAPRGADAQEDSSAASDASETDEPMVAQGSLWAGRGVQARPGGEALAHDAKVRSLRAKATLVLMRGIDELHPQNLFNDRRDGAYG